MVGKTRKKERPPLSSIREEEPESSTANPYWRRTSFWVLLFAIGVVAFNIVQEVRKTSLPDIVSSTVGAAGTNTGTVAAGTSATTANHGYAQRRLQAAVALRILEEQNRFTTEFSSHAHVLQHGLPRRWKPCVLERLMQQKQLYSPGPPVLQVAVLGGSMSSKPGSNCIGGSDTNQRLVMDGRYSGLLESKWQATTKFWTQKNNPIMNNQNNSSHTVQLKVHNWAQGSTNSVTSALLLDELLLPKQNTDVIVWEFFSNDAAASGGHEEQFRKLDFWLTRLKVHYAQQYNLLPPPIVILYLWPVNAQEARLNGGNAVADESLDFRQMDYMSELLDSPFYQEWDIAVVHAGAAVQPTPQLQANPKLLCDDTGCHPSCKATKFIADLLMYAFYSNWIIDDDDNNDNHNLQQQCLAPTQVQPEASSASLSTASSVQPQQHKFLWANFEKPFKALWTDLFREDAKLGSITAWEPHVQGQSSLQIDNLQEIQSHDTHNVAKEDEFRKDRKYAFTVPSCSSHSNKDKLEFHLAEPELKWIGLSAGGPGFRIIVNGVQVQDEPPPIGWCFGTTGVSHWIPILNHVIKSTKYVISFCDMVSPTRAHVQFLVGVSVPNATAIVRDGNAR